FGSFMPTTTRATLAAISRSVHGALLAAGLVDEVALFVAPKLVGAGGVPLIGVDGPTKMADAWRLGAVSTRRLGDDILVVGDVLRSA
ncbi:MAG TPA: dihydrofolate reductase family protein, partial [Polyangia bacterium]|nr:dihydrofolate reductase family protein [Polyangia bacterium]